MSSLPANSQPKIWTWLPGVVVSLLAIMLLAKLATWEDLRQAAAQVALKPVLLAGGALLLSVFFRALAWWTLLQKRAGFGRVFMTLNEGYLLNNLFPLRLGEVGRVFLLGAQEGLSPTFVLPTIVLERAFDLALAAGLLLATLPLVIGADWAAPVAGLVLAVVVSGLLVIYALSRTQSAWQPRLAGWLEKRKGLRAAVLPRVNSLLDGFKAVTNPGQFFGSFGLMLLSWAGAVLQYYFLMISLFPQAQGWWAAFVLGTAGLGVAIPSAPGSLGVFEAAIVGALSLLGVNEPGTALVYAITLHVIYYVSSSGLGLIGLASEGQSLFKLYQQVTSFRLFRTE